MIQPVTGLHVVYPSTPHPDDGGMEVNPSVIRWEESLDDTEDVSYVVDIVRASDDQVVETIPLGRGTTYVGMDREVTLDATHLPDGDYYCVMWAVSTDEDSAPSGRSNVWRIRG